MEIYNTIIDEPFNFEERLRPLFDAMRAGKKIKSVTCMAGTINKDNREKDFKIKNFKALYYYVAMMQNYDGSEKYDLVDTDKKDNSKARPRTMFYMNWVISFEL